MKSELLSLLHCAFIGDKGSILFDFAVASDVWLFFNYYAWLGFQQGCWGLSKFNGGVEATKENPSA